MALLNKMNCSLCVIDVQEAFRKTIGLGSIVPNINLLIRVAGILNVPVIKTEQYSRGLGKTVKEISLDIQAIEKTAFSCFGSDGFIKALSQIRKEQLILAGIETHICISQTALDAMKNGYEVFVAKDATSANSPEKKETALDGLLQAGCRVKSTEQIIYELARDASDPKFGEILDAVKNAQNQHPGDLP
ncbi:MAG: isochorismatase family protein [archaeon]